jgi:6-phosphogluconolactonase (cycloisomerase 2 family)
VWRYRFIDGNAHPEPPLTVTPGAGPRHLALTGPERGWLVGELEPAIFPLPDGDPVAVHTGVTSVRNYPSAIVASPDRRFLYVANRGPDTIAVFQVGPQTVRQIAEVRTGAEWPRDAAVVGDFVYVAGQQSDNVTVLRRDALTGQLSDPAVALKVGSPTCVVMRG